MTFVFRGIVNASISLAVAYFLLLLYVSYQLFRVHTRELYDIKPVEQPFSVTSSVYTDVGPNYQSIEKPTPLNSTNINQNNLKPILNTKKLFIMSCLLLCLLRFMSFSSMAMFDLTDHEGSSSVESPSKFDDDITGTENFFEKAFLVLFDFPDFCFVSAYCLLIVVWGEAYLHSRRHWLSSSAFKRVWMLSYLIFNICLYGCQVGLYTLLFIPSVDKSVLSAFLYLTLAAYNLVLPILWSIVYIYLSIKFAGFPYASFSAQQRLSRLGAIVSLWTLTRIGWGFVTLTSVLRGWLNYLSTTTLGHTSILILIFMLAEIFPIVFSLRSSMLGSFSDTASEAIFDSMYNRFSSPFRKNSYQEESLSPLPLPHSAKHRSYWTTKSVDPSHGNEFLISQITSPQHPQSPQSLANMLVDNSRPIDVVSDGSRAASATNLNELLSSSYQSDDSFVSARSFHSSHGTSKEGNRNSSSSIDGSESSSLIGQRVRRQSLSGFWRSWMIGSSAT